jgi:hypothetical protein
LVPFAFRYLCRCFLLAPVGLKSVGRMNPLHVCVQGGLQEGSIHLWKTCVFDHENKCAEYLISLIPELFSVLCLRYGCTHIIWIWSNYV